MTGLAPVLVTWTDCVAVVTGVLDHVDLSGVEQQTAVGTAGRVVAARDVDRLGLSHRRQHVQEPGALFGRRRADVGRRAHEDLLDQRRASGRVPSCVEA